MLRLWLILIGISCRLCARLAVCLLRRHLRLFSEGFTSAQFLGRAGRADRDCFSLTRLWLIFWHWLGGGCHRLSSSRACRRRWMLRLLLFTLHCWFLPRWDSAPVVRRSDRVIPQLQYFIAIIKVTES